MERVYHIGVCDNDAFTAGAVAENAEALLKKAGWNVTADTYTEVRQLYAAMKKTSFDLLLLDIDMPGMSGIQFGRKLREEGNEIDIIFVSNYDKLVFDTFCVTPFGFVRKNNFKKDFAACIDALTKKLDKKREVCVLIRQGNRDISVPVKEILYIENFKKKQDVYVKNQEKPLVMTSTMGNLEELLAEHGFLRINHGCLVNYEAIRSISVSEAKLKNDTVLPVSRRRGQQVREQYFSLMKSNGNIVF